MPDTTRLSAAAGSAAADAVTALLNGGFLDILDGTQPADADTAITTQVRLATLTFASPAFAPASGGIAVSNSLGSETNAPATGTATWFRTYKADHTTVVFDGSVGTAPPSNLVLTTTAILAGGGVSSGPLTYTQQRAPCP